MGAVVSENKPFEWTYNARVDVNFAGVDVNFQKGHCDLILLTIFFHFDTNLHSGPTNIPYKISGKYT